jgi:hypothetical protein
MSIYLAQSSLIKGEKPLGTKCPKWISIKPYGIETVERKEKKFAKMHNELLDSRFFLSYMLTILQIMKSIQFL